MVPCRAAYLVTLAIVETTNPDNIISQFVSAAARTVTAENGGKFSEVWDGLDENFMPVPPGDYAVKGIYSPAAQWRIDKEWHAITPHLSAARHPGCPRPRIGGWPNRLAAIRAAPMRDVAIGSNGVAVFYYEYLENGRNLPMVDLNKPLGISQCLRAFDSGGAGGGPCVATDGDTVWAFSTDGGPKFVYRADRKSFGSSHEANRANSYLPQGWVTAMGCLAKQGHSQVLRVCGTAQERSSRPGEIAIFWKARRSRKQDHRT